MAIPIEIFSLADVMGKADQARAARQQDQMNQMKMQEFQRNQQEMRTLGDIMSRSITTTGGSPAIAAQPEQVMPEGILGPPRPESEAVPAVRGRTDFDYNKMFEQAQNLPEAMRGPLLQKLHAARATEEDRRLAMQLKMAQARQVGSGTAQERQARIMIDQRAQEMLEAGEDRSKIMAWKKQAEREVAEAIFTAPKAHIDPNTGTITRSEVSLPPSLGGKRLPPSPASVEFGDRAFDKEIEKFGNQIQEKQLYKVEAPIKIVDAAIKKYGKSIPGVGYGWNSGVSTALKNDIAQKVTSARQALFNIDLKLVSGAAVTLSEEDRKRIEDAMKLANSSEDYVNIYNDLIRPAYKNLMNNLVAKENPRALDIYEKRGGMKLRDFNNYLSVDKSTSSSAPKAAIDALKADPSLAPQFKAKYGYLP